MPALDNVSDPSRLTGPSAEVPAARTRQPRLLLADDSPEIRQSLVKLLHRAGYDVVTAAHGGQVLELLFHGDYDLLLLDLNMPEFDGWETLDRVAVFKPDLPVVIITAQPHQRDWVAGGGARALVEKPFDTPLLLRTLAELLESGRVAAPAASAPPSFRHVRPERGGFSSPFRVWGINE